MIRMIRDGARRVLAWVRVPAGSGLVQKWAWAGPGRPGFVCTSIPLPPIPSSSQNSHFSTSHFLRSSHIQQQSRCSTLSLWPLLECQLSLMPGDHDEPPLVLYSIPSHHAVMVCCSSVSQILLRRVLSGPLWPELNHNSKRVTLYGSSVPALGN